MSWAEVFKINKNMKRALNEQIRDLKCNPMRVITTTQSFTPEKTGLYKVICVGAGADSYGNTTSYSSDMIAEAGSGGGVALKTIKLYSSKSYNVTVSTTASFAYDSTALTATPGVKGTYNKGGTPGTGNGGDYNFTGVQGVRNIRVYENIKGGSVGCHISEISYPPLFQEDLVYGESLLGYGGGAPVRAYSNSGTGSTFVTVAKIGLPAAVIIIPLEMEE